MGFSFAVFQFDVANLNLDKKHVRVNSKSLVDDPTFPCGAYQVRLLANGPFPFADPYPNERHFQIK